MSQPLLPPPPPQEGGHHSDRKEEERERGPSLLTLATRGEEDSICLHYYGAVGGYVWRESRRVSERRRRWGNITQGKRTACCERPWWKGRGNKEDPRKEALYFLPSFSFCVPFFFLSLALWSTLIFTLPPILVLSDPPPPPTFLLFSFLSFSICLFTSWNRLTHSAWWMWMWGGGRKEGWWNCGD